MGVKFGPSQLSLGQAVQEGIAAAHYLTRPGPGSTRSSCGSPGSSARSSPVASSPPSPIWVALMRYIRQCNKAPKTIKSRYRDPTRRITLDFNRYSLPRILPGIVAIFKTLDQCNDDAR